MARRERGGDRRPRPDATAGRGYGVEPPHGIKRFFLRPMLAPHALDGLDALVTVWTVYFSGTSATF